MAITTSNTHELCGIDFVQDTVVRTLNSIFDPKEVARQNELAKLEKDNGKKKKGKKKGDDSDSKTPATSVENTLSDEDKKAIADAAAAGAKEFSRLDAMVTSATRPEFGDYQVNAAMGLAKAVGMNPR